MIKDIDDYLGQLKKEMRDSDPALIQDALSDAEEHLRTALETVLKDTPGVSEENMLPTLIEKYGTPSEIASAYSEIESRTSPALAPPRRQEKQSFFVRSLSVFADPQAWGASLYMLFAFLTGLIYGLWAFIGVSLSFILLLLIIGLPWTGLFLLSVRGIALIEGRIVEALLGIRMPRKPLFVQKGLSWKGKFKALITESHTWKALAYMILQFPLGMIYFLVIVVLFAASIKFTFYPLWYFAFNRPLLTIGHPIFIPVWAIPFVCMAGFILLALALHLSKFVAKIHGQYAKSILVRK